MSKRRNRFEDEHEEHIDESWLIPYADILTLLLALFIVLFASSEVDKVKFQSIMDAFKSEFTGTKIDNTQAGLSVKPQENQNTTPAEKTEPPATPAATDTTEDTELNQLKEKLQKYISDNNLQAVVILSDTKRGVEISLKDVVLFDPGNAELKSSSFKTLDVLVGLASTVSNPISIEGHTDNVPIRNSAFESNWELSAARAVSVLHYFETRKISDARLQFVGYGEYKPLVPNDTKEHRQANRRVNIVILRNS